VREELITLAELDQWWNPWNPLPENPLPPSWIKAGEVFAARNDAVSNRSIICTVKPGWVSFFDQQVGHPHEFRMMEYEKFHQHWKPLKLPTAWERILQDD